MNTRSRVLVFSSAWIAFGLVARSQVVAPSTRLVSASSSMAGTANGESAYADISDDGRYVAFKSRASDLVALDGNGVPDIFVRDLQNSTTALVSVALSGASGNQASTEPAISADGRIVAFASAASDLVVGDTFNTGDVFERDLLLGTTTLVSIGIGGAKPNQSCDVPKISGDGRIVCFYSRASNLVVGDTNGTFDIFARDMLTGTTVRVNESATGAQSTFPAVSASISDDGRWVAFRSAETSLVFGDANGRDDVFVKDLQTGAIEIASLGHLGQQGNHISYAPALSEDARFVVFGSLAGNLVPIDKNSAGPFDGGDIFIRDRLLGTTRMVNVGAGLEQRGSGICQDPAVSSDGRWASFTINTSLIPWTGPNVEHVYLKDLATEAIYRASQGPGGVQANGRSFRGAIARDGRAIAFDTSSTNFASPDQNGVIDVFVHSIGTPVPVTYCTAKVNSLGCTPRISWSGWPGVSAQTHFFIVGGNMLGNTNGVMFYGINGRDVAPFSGGLLCVHAQIKRAVATQSTGNTGPGLECANAFLLDFQAFASGALGGNPLPALQMPGTTVDAQWWGRDNAFAVDKTQLSDAIEFVLRP